MKERLFRFFRDVRDSKLRWISFAVVVVIMVAYGFYFLQVDVRLRRNTLTLSTIYMQNLGASLMVGQKRKAYKDLMKNIGEMEIPYVVINHFEKPMEWHQIFYPRLFIFKGDEVERKDRTSRALKCLMDHIRTFRMQHRPILISKTGKPKDPYKIYYGNPGYIKGMILFPFVQILFIIAFVATLYLWIKNRELIKQSNLWIGFAKETAHQLGTPISSLLGWVEMMKIKLKEPDDISLKEKVAYIMDEMSEDINKLHRNSLRFSQIGSVPDLILQDLNDVVKEVILYFKDRMPQSERHIQIIANYGNLPNIFINKDLIGWVLENLLKNSMDAIIKKEGIIEIETSFIEKDRKIRITHSDNGKGIKRENINRIFDPGFSTKRRGWGLGLALAKRMVTDYHLGKIYVESTQMDRGTTFIIELPVRVGEHQALGNKLFYQSKRSRA